MKVTVTAAEVWAATMEKGMREKNNIRNLTWDEFMVLHMLLHGRDPLDNPEYVRSLEAKEAGMTSALWLRIKHFHDYQITPGICYFLSAVIRNFAEMTMMANYLQYVAFTRKLEKIGPEEICRQVFPAGFPTDAFWKSMWALQKMDEDELMKRRSDGSLASDNVLDYGESTESIRLRPDDQK